MNQGKKYIFLVLILVPVWVLLESFLIKSAGPPSCHANEPILNLNCTEAGCHDDGTANTGTANVSMNLGGATGGYVAGQTYTITISITKTGMLRSGFQTIVLQDSNTTMSAGMITLIDTARTQVIDVNHPHPGSCGNQATKVWVEHTFTGINNVSAGTNTWSYEWQAPAASTGNVTFYASVLESDNSLDETGDNVYTLSQTISPLGTSVGEIEANNLIEIYPNPNTGEFVIRSKDWLAKEASLYSSEGKLLEKFILSSETQTITLKHYAKGIYFLKASSDQSSFYGKIVLE